MCTHCAPLVADLFLICNAIAFILSLFLNIQTDAIGAFTSTLKYLDDYLLIINYYFEQMVSKLHPTEHKLNEAN